MSARPRKDTKILLQLPSRRGLRLSGLLTLPSAAPRALSLTAGLQTRHNTCNEALIVTAVGRFLSGALHVTQGDAAFDRTGDIPVCRPILLKQHFQKDDRSLK